MKYKKIDLIEAVIDNNLKKLNQIISVGCDLDIKDQNGFSALHYASQNQLIEIVKTLLDNGAMVDIKDSDGNTPLCKAIYYSEGKGEVIKELLSHGANKNQKNNHGVSPLDLANMIANYDVKKFLE